MGIDPEEEERMAEIKPFGLQSGETEDTSEYSLKVNDKFSFVHKSKSDYI